MSDTTRKHLDAFGILDEILNALLFMLIGLEILVLTFTRELFFAGLLAFRRSCWRAGERGLARDRDASLAEIHARNRHHHDVGGLRGGISVALALSLLPVTNVKSCWLSLTSWSSFHFGPRLTSSESCARW